MTAKVGISRRGTVSLRGNVTDFQAKRAVEEDARVVEGVNRVLNDLIVPLADPAERIDVTVENGVVTLEDSVNAFWKRHRAKEGMLGLVGVVDVRDELEIAKP